MVLYTINDSGVHACAYFPIIYCIMLSILSLPVPRFTDALAGNVKQLVASVHPSLRLFTFSVLNRMTFKFEFLHVHGS